MCAKNRAKTRQNRDTIIGIHLQYEKWRLNPSKNRAQTLREVNSHKITEKSPTNTFIIGSKDQIIKLIN